MKNALLFAALLCMTVHVKAQSLRDNIFDPTVPVTWLGMDFTHLKFIGTAAQWQDAGEVTDVNMRDKYFTSWNEIFIKEEKKYNVAGAIDRSSVTYATDITGLANNSERKGSYFSNDPADFHTLDEQKINGLVKHYNFKGKTGIGLLFFVDGMDKGLAQASVWVVFVDMGKKEVLLAKHMDEKGGGFGFRNYWAKSFYNTLKDMGDDFKHWSK